MEELSFAQVGEILQLLQKIDGSEVTLEWGDLKIHVRRGGDQRGSGEPTTESARATSAQLPTADSAPASDGAPTEQSPDDADASPAEAPVPTHWIAVESPMVGTFYRTPKPDEPPFVEVGDTVNAGDVLALVEVMKLFTELRTGVSGKVARVDADNGSLVEFGQPLIWIEPA